MTEATAEHTTSADCMADEALSARIRQALQQDAARMAQAEQQFVDAYPAYTATKHLDALRATGYSRLDEQQHIYLDYTGGGLYSTEQLDEHFSLLRDGVFGNPHSTNPTSQAMTILVDQTREAIHHHFNADPDEYVVIFTQNASHALKLVGESYPFTEKGRFALTYDNHNSVNGIREFARRQGTPVVYIPVDSQTLRIDPAIMHPLLDAADPGQHNLLAFPAQSNYSGVKHDLGWVARAQERGWHVLVDGAAYVPSNQLDLSQIHPDFVSVSFYKMFGYPTGVGALIARRETLALLRRPWFAGGTISAVSVQGDGHYLYSDHAGYEDGTVDYLTLPAIAIGLRHLQDCDMQAITSRVRCLTDYLLQLMTVLIHSNDSPMVQVYGPQTSEQRGGTIAFNLFDADGVIFDHRTVERWANQARISLRTGCFCNPGAVELALQLKAETLKTLFGSQQAQTFETMLRQMVAIDDVRGLGAVRISVGLVSNFADVYHFVSFLRAFIDTPSAGILGENELSRRCN